MKVILSSLALWLFTGTSLAAQDLDRSALLLPAILTKDAHSVVREYEQVYEVKSPNSAVVTVRKVVTLLDDNHDYANRLVVYYDDDSKITRFRATVYDALGVKVRSARKSEIVDVRATDSGTFYDDSRVQTTTVTHLSYPYTVEFEYEKKVTNFGIVEFASWLPMEYHQSVQTSRFTALVPTDNELIYRSNDLPDPDVSVDGDTRTYRWEVKDLAARRAEALAPPATQTLPYLRTVLKHFDVGDYAGSMASWQDFGTFMGQLLAGRDALPETLRLLVHETTDHLATNREKIDALYRLLQERTRYVGVQLGIGGWQPFPATYVEENRFGDCKALSNYLGAMLKEVGIPTYPVLIHWSDRAFYPVSEDFTTSAFNHMVLYVPEEDMYLECTSSVAPPGYLGEGKEDRNVLWVTPEGGKLVRTPPTTPGENGFVRRREISLKADGSATLDLRAAYFGGSQEYFRQLLRYEQDPAKQLEYLERRETLPDVSGHDYSLTCAPDAPTAALAYRTELPGYGRKLGKRLFVPLNKYYGIDRVPEKVAERQLPVRQHQARFYVDTVRLTVPTELEVESLGQEEIRYTHAAGEYLARVTTDEQGHLTWIRTLKILPVTLPASEYADYRQFYVDVAKADNRQVVLRQKRTK